MISEKKQLKIANHIYANVSGRFAFMCNAKYRGVNFSWESFVTDCEQEAEIWVLPVCGRDKKETIRLAQKYAREISQRLVDRLTE